MLHVVEVSLSVDDSPVVEEALAAMELPFASWRLPGRPLSTIRLFSSLYEEAVERAVIVEDLLASWQSFLHGVPPEVQLTTIQREEWAECWKAFFKTFSVTDRLVVSPSWEEYTPASGEVVVELDPGMCFGTGYHGTTRACLEFLDSLADARQGEAFLEAGCGSGILSLAARKLGFGAVTGFDHDPDAVRVARSNLGAQGVDDVVLTCAEIAEFDPGPGYAVVVANILAVVLLGYAECVAGFVDRSCPGARLILSGILTDQYEEVKVCYEGLGFVECQRRTIDEWTSGMYVSKG